MNTSTHRNRSLQRGVRPAAVALLAWSLSLTGFAQSSGTSDTGSSTAGSTGAGSSGSDTQSTWDTGTSASGSSTAGAGASGTTSSGSAADSGHGTRSSERNTASADVKRADKKFITQVAESTPREIALAQLAAQRAANPQVKSFAQQMVSDHQMMSQQLVQVAQQKGITLENPHLLGTTGTSLHGPHRSTSDSGATTASPHSGMASTPAGSPRAAGTEGTNASTGLGSTDPIVATGATANTAMTSASVPSEITSDRQYRRLAEKSGAEFDREFVSMMLDHHKRDLKLFEKHAKDAEDNAIRSFASQHVPVLQQHLEHAETLNQSVAE